MANLDDLLRDELLRAVGPAPDDEALFGALSRRRARRRGTRRVGSALLAIVVVAASIGGFLALSHVFRSRIGPADTITVRNGSIIYSSTYGPDGDGDHHLWIGDADGSNATQLTSGSGVDVGAAVSPDGRLVAFIRLDWVGRFGKWSLWTTTLTGEEHQLTDTVNQLTEGRGYPEGLSFSPDGSRIVIDTGVFGPYGIWTIAVDGSDPQLVGATDEIPVSGASWSPDGRSIVYSGSPTASGLEGPWDLYVVGVDAAPDDIGRQLTRTAVDETDPSWSPDGSTIAFQQSLEVEGQPGTGIGSIAADGSGSTTLVQTQGCCLQEPTWAPDASSLLFVFSNKVESLVQRIAPDGTMRTTLVRGADGPAWQPRLELSLPTKDAGSDAAPSDLAQVVCSKDAVRIETPVVKALEDGVHLSFDNSGGVWGYGLHHQSWDQGTSEGGELVDGITDVTSAIGPGIITVSCLQDGASDYDDPDTPTATLTVVDPDGLHVPWDLSCGSGEQSRLTLAAAAGEDEADVFRRVPGVRSTDSLLKPGYPRSPQHWPTLIVVRDEVVIARIGAPSTSGTWELLIDACPGSGIGR